MGARGWRLPLPGFPLAALPRFQARRFKRGEGLAQIASQRLVPIKPLTVLGYIADVLAAESVHDQELWSRILREAMLDAESVLSIVSAIKSSAEPSISGIKRALPAEVEYSHIKIVGAALRSSCCGLLGIPELGNGPEDNQLDQPVHEVRQGRVETDCSCICPSIRTHDAPVGDGAEPEHGDDGSLPVRVRHSGCKRVGPHPQPQVPWKTVCRKVSDTLLNKPNLEALHPNQTQGIDICEKSVFKILKTKGVATAYQLAQDLCGVSVEAKSQLKAILAQLIADMTVVKVEPETRCSTEVIDLQDDVTLFRLL
mmetsp:Transcript_20006/g.47676  ORF Transcript_20006/g.47676 Transcript_20006/m.47676 type:complete len:312 (-) Transcript_20006:416-1351(-)